MRQRSSRICALASSLGMRSSVPPWVPRECIDSAEGSRGLSWGWERALPDIKRNAASPFGFVPRPPSCPAAPHLPVHLGAMSEAVKYQIR